MSNTMCTLAFDGRMLTGPADQPLIGLLSAHGIDLPHGTVCENNTGDCTLHNTFADMEIPIQRYPFRRKHYAQDLSRTSAGSRAVLRERRPQQARHHPVAGPVGVDSVVGEIGTESAVGRCEM